MPQLIQVPGLGPVSFPDDMSTEQIEAALSEHEFSQTQSGQAVTSAPYSPPSVDPLTVRNPLAQRPTPPLTQGEELLPRAFKSVIPQSVLEAPGKNIAAILPMLGLSPEAQQRTVGAVDTLSGLVGTAFSPAGPSMAAASIVPGIGPLMLGGMSAQMIGQGAGKALYSNDPYQQGAGVMEGLAGLFGAGYAGVKGFKQANAALNPTLNPEVITPPDPKAFWGPRLRDQVIDVQEVTREPLQLKAPEYAETIRSDKGVLPKEGLRGEGSQTPRSGDLQRERGGSEGAGYGVLRGEAPQGTSPLTQGGEPIGKGIEAALKKNREAGTLYLPGPRMLRERKGINVDPEARVNGPQLLKKLKGALTKEELGVYMKAGLEEFLKVARTGNEVAQWMEDNGPRWEVKQYGAEGVATDARAKLQDLGHNWLDQLSPDEQRLVGIGTYMRERRADVPEALKAKAQEYYEAYDAVMRQESETEGGQRYTPSTAVYREAGVYPADPKKYMIERIEVTSPTSKFPANRAHGTSEGSIGWGTLQRINDKDVLFEVQSDLLRQLEKEAKAGFADYATGGPTKGDPLVADHERLVLKAVVDLLRQRGRKSLVIADTATAHIAQGTDRNTDFGKLMTGKEVMDKHVADALEPARRNSYLYTKVPETLSPEAVEAVKRSLSFDYGPDWQQGKYMQVEREGGLPTLYRIDKPENNIKFRVDPAKELAEKFPEGGPINRYQAGMEAAHGVKGRYGALMRELTGDEGKAVSVGPLGKKRPTKEGGFSLYGPKKDVSGIEYSLERVSEDQPVFGKGRPEAPKTPSLPGIQINKAMEERGQGGESGAIFIPQIVKDILKKFTPSPSTKVAPGSFRSEAGKGPLVKFQVYPTEKAMAGEYKGFGAMPVVGRFFDPRANVKDPIDAAFLAHRQQRSKADAHEGFLVERGKALVDHLKDLGPALAATVNSEALLPGSVPGLNPKQQAVIRWWADVKKQLEAYAQHEGLTRFRDRQGRPVGVANIDFPAGAEDFYGGLAQRVGEVLRAVADERMATDPALQGRLRTGLGRGPTGYAPVPQISRRRVFPTEVARRLEKFFRHDAGSTVEKMGWTNDILKIAETTGDLSFLGQQGLGILTRRPDAWAKAFALSMRSLARPRTLSRYLLHNTKSAQKFIELGGTLAKIEEFAQGAKKQGPLRKIPYLGAALGPPAEHLGQAMTTFMSVAKLEMFKALEGKVPNEQLRELVESIDTTAGSGRMESIGVSSVRALVERLVMFAPAYYRAGLNNLANLPRGGIAGSEARKSVLGMAGGLMLAAYGIYTYMGMKDDEKLRRLTPGNKDFLRFPLTLDNGDRIEMGPGHIVLGLIKLGGSMTAHLAQGDMKAVWKDLIKFASYRTAPLLKLGDELWHGKDVLDREVGPLAAVGRAVTPISAEDALFGKGKFGTKAAEAAISFFGGQSRPESLSEMRDRLMMEEAGKLGKEWNQLSADERAKITETIDPLLDVKRTESEKPTEQIAVEMRKKRGDALNAAMPEDVKTFLQKHKLVLPAYDEYLKHKGETIMLAPDEREALQRGVYAGSEAAVRQLMKENLSSLTQKQKEARLKRHLDRQNGRFRERLERTLQK